MKLMNKYIVLLLSVAALVACSDGLNNKVKFEVEAVVDNQAIADDEITVKVGQPITFQFSGNPDFISFYSGEAGQDYDLRNETESSKELITTRLDFTAIAQWGNSQNLKVLISQDFAGLSKKPKQDFQSIEDATWIDISDQCELPEKPNFGKDKQIKKSSVDLSDYLEEDLVIAFHYEPTTNDLAQSKWELVDLQIVNTDKKTGDESFFIASSMNFLPFDVKEFELGEKGDPYKTVTDNTEGVWNLSRLSETPPVVQIWSTAKGRPLKNTWLISQPLKLNARTPDKGLAIKAINNYINEYTHTYSRVGEYKVAFIATNAKYEHESQVVKRLNIKVTE